MPGPGIAGLARRLLGERADDVVIEPLPEDPAGSAFEAEASGGVLTVRGADGVAQASALHWYLKHACAQQVTWDSPGVEPPGRLPPLARTRRTTPFRHRYYLNYVTFGYSAAFWDWDRWEREIDWMALHGINLPLAATGHEAVRLAAYRSLGLDDTAALRWIGGPAHLPWTWMGCTNGWGGPLSEHWIDSHTDLARRILARERQLGMRAVLPGFAGHVPRELAGPGAHTVEWQGFRTAVLEPGTDRFQEVADAYMREQARLFGTDHHYAVDPFIEMVPPDGDPGYLRDLGAAIYRGMSATDPQAVWVLQGWPFHYHRHFWTAERVEAFLDGIPPDRVLVLDLWAEHAPMWLHNNAFHGRPWVWCMVHNFGGRPALFGDLGGLAGDVTEATGHPDRGRLSGLGMTMEAIENNPVVYELATDLVWQQPGSVASWVREYAYRRYGVRSAAAERAWAILASTVYGPGRTRSTPSPLIARPKGAASPFRSQRLAGEALADAPERESANVDPDRDPSRLADLPLLAEAATALLDVAEQAGPAGPVGRDLVDLVSYVVAQQAREPIKAMAAALPADDRAALRAATAELMELIDDVDDLVATREDQLLGRWLADARRWGTTPDERDLLERDARLLVTVWGRQDSGLHDYSGRHWSGLLTGFYRPRWQVWAGWLDEQMGRPEPDVPGLMRRIADFEQAWVDSRDSYPTEPRHDLLGCARRLLDRYPPAGHDEALG